MVGVQGEKKHRREGGGGVCGFWHTCVCFGWEEWVCRVAKHSHLFVSRGAVRAVSYCLMQMRCCFAGSFHLQRINNDINI